MCDAGIDVRLYIYKRQDVLAKCRIDFATLESDFSTSPPVRYAEFYAADRYEFEHPAAFLICGEHKSMIHVLHPEESEAKDAPWFPARED